MKEKIINLLVIISALRLWPHVILFLLSKNYSFLLSDLNRWSAVKQQKSETKFDLLCCFFRFMTLYPEYRSQFYFRLGYYRFLVIYLCKPMSHLYILTPNVGEGLFVQHGFSTIISAKSIGNNCWINQQVTIGYSNDTDCPIIGNNVVINAGAKVIGDVRIGNNSKIGANATVVKNVPDNCVVVGTPAYIVKRNGIKCKEPLS
ncbi:hypothetical protein BCT61_17340 [Vibrio breoganii]|uniref:serine O-acetyltransferase n=1 Tax=Vibrio breoganii TaxID=553239 RepID=UPI000C84BADC|nr:serine acetyltransferase [Vibrio breoganii]PMM04017.1 hypothetical protein BCT61_17340 [Vibrio breoganii]